MNIREKAQQMAAAIELTADDSKTFEIRGSFGSQCRPALDKVMVLTEHDTREIETRKGKLHFTDLHFVVEDDETLRARCTIGFDFQNIFLKDDTSTSLQKLGEGTNGQDVLKLMANFRVVEVVDTGLYPMKYSLAAQQCGFPIGHTYSDMDMAKLRAKYRADGNANKSARTDNTDDITWLQIKHVIIESLA